MGSQYNSWIRVGETIVIVNVFDNREQALFWNCYIVGCWFTLIFNNTSTWSNISLVINFWARTYLMNYWVCRSTVGSVWEKLLLLWMYLTIESKLSFETVILLAAGLHLFLTIQIHGAIFLWLLISEGVHTWWIIECVGEPCIPGDKTEHASRP